MTGVSKVVWGQTQQAWALVVPALWAHLTASLPLLGPGALVRMGDPGLTVQAPGLGACVTTQGFHLSTINGSLPTVP